MDAPAHHPTPHARRSLVAAAALMLFVAASVNAQSGDDDSHLSGRGIMEESQARHQQFPYAYEEQTMVLIDEAGNREVRKCRRYTRVEKDGTFKFLLTFDDPEVIRGVALRAVRSPDGKTVNGVYLPAFGAQLKAPSSNARGGNFLGTDFTVEDLAVEPLGDYRYVRTGDRIIDEVSFFVVDAYPANDTIERDTGYALRRHIVRKDNLVVVQTDFYDRGLRFFKRITRHDLKRVDGDSWRANMIVANDQRERHRTLLKIDRRIYSKDYVPAELFEPEYLLANRHLVRGSLQTAGRQPVTPAAAENGKSVEQPAPGGS